MLFKHSIYVKILTGDKTVTRRPLDKVKGRQVYEQGKVYPILNGYKKPTHWIRIKSKTRQALGKMTEEDAHKEGFETLAEFKLTWVALYGKKWNPRQVVWVYDFELLTEKPVDPSQRNLGV